MPTTLNPYLGFRGNAREAINFYSSVFGGEPRIGTFADFHASQVPEEQDWVMHAQLATPNGLTLMAADIPTSMEFTPGNTISVSLSGDDEDTLRGYWDALSDGGTVIAPFERAPWGDLFGECVDRFGIIWLVNVAAQPMGSPS